MNQTVELEVRKGIFIYADLIKSYPNGKLYFAQEYLILTDLNDKILDEINIIDFVEEVF